jgi:hypothetical protein
MTERGVVIGPYLEATTVSSITSYFDRKGRLSSDNNKIFFVPLQQKTPYPHHHQLPSPPRMMLPSQLQQLPSPPRMMLPSQLQQATNMLSPPRIDNNIVLSPPRMFLPAQLRRATNIITQQTTRENTQLAYNPKIAEFKQFCDFVYQHTPIENARYTVDREKVEVFMHYRSCISSNVEIHAGRHFAGCGCVA